MRSQASAKQCAMPSTYTRTDDRSKVGVLVEFQRLLRFDVSDPSELSLLDVSLHLAWMPIVARNTFPVDATCRVFGVEPPP